MANLDLIQPVLWDSWVAAALSDLVGKTLWGSLFVAGVLTITGIVRRSPWTLMLAALLSLAFCVPVALMYSERFLFIPLTLAALATILAAIRRLHHA